MPSGSMAGCRWKGPRGAKWRGIRNLSGGNMGPLCIICGSKCGMFGCERNWGRWGPGVRAGACSEGKPGREPGMIPGSERAITGARACPRRLSVCTESMFLSALASSSWRSPPAHSEKSEVRWGSKTWRPRRILSSYWTLLPAAKAVRSISGWMKAAPAGAMDAGDMMTGKASGLPMGVACWGWTWKTKMQDIIVTDFKLKCEVVKLKSAGQQCPFSLLLEFHDLAPSLKRKKKKRLQIKENTWTQTVFTI